MNKIFFLAILCLVFESYGKTTLYFEPGVQFQSRYSDDVGTANLVMTGNPGQLMITTNQNKCKKGTCESKVFPDELNYTLFRFVWSSEDDGSVIYRGRLVPFNSYLAERTFPKGYESNLAKYDITIRVSLVESDSVGSRPEAQGDASLFRPKKIVMILSKEGRSKEYHLEKVLKKAKAP